MESRKVRPDDPRRFEILAERKNAKVDLPFEELAELDSSLIQTYSDFQEKTFKGDVLAFIVEPLPIPSSDEEEDLQHKLCMNTSSYDGEGFGEDFFDEVFDDYILLEMLKHKRKFSNSETFSLAIRARASIVARLLLLNKATSNAHDSTAA